MKNKQLEEKEQKSLVWVEANLEELPIFSASKRVNRHNLVVWERKGRDPQSGTVIDQKLTLRPAAGLGLPAERERDLYYLVIAPSIDRDGFGADGQIGPIRYTEACRMLGWKRSGQNYQQIREAAETMVSLNIKFENCIIDGDTRKISGIVENMFRGLRYYEERKANDAKARGESYPFRRGEFYLYAADWFRRNYYTNYLKPIDTALYKSLRRALSKCLYSYLDKRGWDRRRKTYRPEVRENISELKQRFRLGARRYKDILKEFRLAHKELVEKWPALRRADVEKLQPGRYEAVYVFEVQTELRLPATKLRGDAPETEVLVQELVKRGIPPAVAQDLTQKYPDTIEKHIDIFDQETGTAKQIANPGGYLRQRIEQDWPPFQGYRTPEEREAETKRREKEEQTRLLEHRRQKREEEQWRRKTPEEKAEINLNRWLMVQKSLRNEPTSEEIERKRSEYLQEYQRARREGT